MTLVRTFSRVPVLLLGLGLLAGCGSAPVLQPRASSGRTPRKVSVNDLRERIVRDCHVWLGRDYCGGGTGEECFDCSGLVTRVYSNIGILLPRSARDMFGVGRSVRRADLRPGDLVFFRNTAGRGITHVGVYAGGGMFIHSSTHKGVIRSALSDDYYARHYAGARDMISK
jgi:murein DD-endopeptidase / murein LD-carboxypeptidase